VPTVNQVSDLLTGLQDARFGDVEVCELLQRAYKPVAERLRPADRMVAHTGFLIFARRLEHSQPTEDVDVRVLSVDSDVADTEIDAD